MVASMIESIFIHVKSLEDMQFLLKYATHVLPEKPFNDVGPSLWVDILTLQDELTAKRKVNNTSLLHFLPASHTVVSIFFNSRYRFSYSVIIVLY